MSNSLALISDAGHMVTDAAALGLALMAQLIARRPPSARHSFGFVRAEALAAFVNSLAMLLLVGWIVYEAAQRLVHPQDVRGATVFIVAAIGACINILVAWVLSRGEQSINTRAALVNVLGDLLGSVAAIAAGAIIYFTNWVRIDPILSIFVSMLILKSTLGILRESYHFLMEGVPHQIDYLAVGADIKAVAGVLSVHDLHVWDMSPGEPALIGHLEIADLDAWPGVLRAVKEMLLDKHGIDHVTLQPETHAKLNY
jgi:cobalt-zinc-cadmium efflux system protein